MALPIENFWLFCCIANSLEDGCLPRIGAANDEDTKTHAVSKIARSSLLPFHMLCSLGFNIGRRHLSLRCLRWWKWWRIKISAVSSVLFGYAGQSQEWCHWLTSMPALDQDLGSSGHFLSKNSEFESPKFGQSLSQNTAFEVIWMAGLSTNSGFEGAAEQKFF